MSKFAELLAAILHDVIASARPGQMFRIDTTAIGKSGPLGAALAADVAEALHCHEEKVFIDDDAGNEIVMAGRCDADGPKFIICHAADSPEGDSAVFVSPNFAGHLRDARVDRKSGLHGWNVIVFTDRAIDTVRASTELTAPGQPLEAGSLIAHIAEQATSTEFRQFVQIAHGELRQAAIRGRAEYRGRVMETLSNLAGEKTPDIGAALPQLGTWVMDSKFQDFLKAGDRQALAQRLRANTEAAETLRAASEGKSDPVTVLEKKIREDRVDKWAKAVPERADLEQWEKDRRTESGAVTKRFDRFRYAKKAAISGDGGDSPSKKRVLELLVHGPEVFQVASLYKEWPKIPPIQLDIDGKSIFKGKADEAPDEFIKVDGKSVVLLCPPAEGAWTFFDLKVHAGKDKPRGSADSQIKVARAPAQNPPFYTPSFALDTTQGAIAIPNGSTCILAESASDYARAARDSTLQDAFGPAEGHELPIRLLAGPAEATDWKLTAAGKQFSVPIACTGEAPAPPEEWPFTSALHNIAMEGNGPRFWRYLSGIRAVANDQGQRPLSVTVNNDLTLENQIVQSRNLFPQYGRSGAVERGDVPALVRSVPAFARVVNAYERLLDWLNENQTLPSLVGREPAYTTLVDAVLDEADKCISDEETDPETLVGLWRLGAVLSETGDIRLSSPLWLPALAYWRTMSTQPLDGQLLATRRAMLSPIAFAPCSILGIQNRGGRALPESSASGFWLKWRNAQQLGDAALEGVGRTVRDRLREFADAFPHLISYHHRAPMLVQFIGIRPSKDIAAGIQEFLVWHLQRVEGMPEDQQPEGDLRLRVEFFVEDPKVTSEFDERMSPDQTDIVPEFGLDPLHEFVDYAKRGVTSLVTRGPSWAHLTFIGRGFRFMPDTVQSSTVLPKGRSKGLIASPTLDLPALASHTPDRIAFGTKGLDTLEGPQALALKFAEAQACLAQGRPYAFREYGNVPGAMATVQTYAALRVLYDKSIWVVHLEPGVSLVPLKADRHHESVLIHFTDQVNPTNAGFDEVTLTKHRQAFDSCIDGVCRELRIVKPEGLLQLLNSINPRWALQLFSNNQRRRIEKIACAMAAKSSLDRVRGEAGERLWLVSGWEDFNRLTGATGLQTSQGAFGDGPRMGTDDVILMGLDPKMPDSLRLLLVEVKYGKHGENKGIEQIQKSVVDLDALASAEGLRGQMFRQELGSYVLRVAERLFVHGAIQRRDLAVIDACQGHLYEGKYTLNWGETDGLPSKGIVVRVDPEAGARSLREGPDGIQLETIPWAEASSLAGNSLVVEVNELAPPAKPIASRMAQVIPAIQIQSKPLTPQSPPKTVAPSAPVATAPVPQQKAKPVLTGQSDEWDSTILSSMASQGYDAPHVDTSKFFGLDSMLHELGIEVDPPVAEDIVVGAQATAIHLRLGPGTRVNKVEQALSTVKLDLAVTKDLSLSTYERAGFVTLFVPHELKKPVPLGMHLGVETLRRFVLPVPAGITADNRPLWIDLVDTNHLLVAGSTGSGKTIYLQGLVLSLAIALPPKRLRIHLVDPKQLDFTLLEGLPHCDGEVVSEVDGTMVLLSELLAEVKERQALLKAAGCRNISDFHKAKGKDSLPYIVTIIDEYNQLLMSCNDKAERTMLEDKVCQLAQIGRALGIYLVVATQRPSADVVSGRIKANFPTRMSFRLPSNTDSRVILDEGGAETLQPGGDGLLAGFGGLRRFQAFYLEPAEVSALVASMNSAAPRFQRPQN